MHKYKSTHEGIILWKISNSIFLLQQNTQESRFMTILLFSTLLLFQTFCSLLQLCRLLLIQYTFSYFTLSLRPLIPPMFIQLSSTSYFIFYFPLSLCIFPVHIHGRHKIHIHMCRYTHTGMCTQSTEKSLWPKQNVTQYPKVNLDTKQRRSALLCKHGGCRPN